MVDMSHSHPPPDDSDLNQDDSNSSDRSSSSYEEEDEDDGDDSSSTTSSQQLMINSRSQEDHIDSAMRHGFGEAYSSEEYLLVEFLDFPRSTSCILHRFCGVAAVLLARDQIRLGHHAERTTGELMQEFQSQQALEKNYFLYWTDPRHDRAGQPKPPVSESIDWRNSQRIRTAAAVLVICLRIGYDPPDVIKTDPCSKLECWVDPYALAKDKALERIGRNLQSQFESLAATPKTRYKQYLDPPVEDAKKFCTAARKNAKNERVLFYYNGHGVPKPTPSGELWLFNKQYTQYIPVSLADVVNWLGSPTIMVWDCSAAGNIVNKVEEFGIKKDADLAQEASTPAPSTPSTSTNGLPSHSTPDAPLPAPESKPPPPSIPFRETIQLGACLGHETLPMNPDLPADLFTCCLTSPIEIALRFFLLRNPLKTNLDIDMLLRIPGKLNDRRTPLGELTWIFTAVTDTIAWNTLPRELFQKLFRHDLVVAALFRGFLLAERIMRFYDCTPISVPALPQTHNHPLWDSWDLAVDMCLAQLPTLLEHERRWIESLPPQPPTLPDQPAPPPPPGPPLPYVHSTFFAEQLTAFEIWLEQGSVAKRQQPEQLPVVLQVLLSQAHRLKALILLCKFLDLGPWAVNVALSIGIFAYILRLLQAPAAELKPVLIYIWARILAVYENCKEDLLKQTYPPTRSVDQAPFSYFVNVLAPSSTPLPIPNVSEHRAMCGFILAICCRNYKPGQVACMRSNVFEACLFHLRDVDPLLRQWSALCIAQIWDDFDEAKGSGVRARAHELFCSILHTDDVPEVRASVLYALGTLLGTSGSGVNGKKFGRSIACSGLASGLSAMEQTDVELGVAMSTLKCSADGSPVVRRELVILLSAIVNEHQGQFITAAYRTIVARANKVTSPERDATGVEGGLSNIATSLIAAAQSDEGPSNPVFQVTMFSCMFKCIFDLMADPHPDVADLAAQVMDHIFTLLFASALGPSARAIVNEIPAVAVADPSKAVTLAGTIIPSTIQSSKSDSLPLRSHRTTSAPMRRGASMASAIKNIALLASAESSPSLPPSALRLSSNGKLSGSSSRLTSLSTSPEAVSSPLQQSASTDSLRYLQSRAARSSASPMKHSRSMTPHLRSAAATPPLDPIAIEAIMLNLVVEDDERLRRRRTMPTMTPDGRTPTNSIIGDKSAPLESQVLPLKSQFFNFSLEYYKESQMKVRFALRLRLILLALY